MDTHRQPPAEAIERAAADWFARLDRGALTEREAGELERWLAENPDHGACLEQICEVLSRTDAPLRNLVNTGRLAVPERVRPLRRSSRWAWAVAGAAAAVCAALLILTWAGPGGVATGPAERRALVLDDGSRVELNGSTRLIVNLGQNVRSVRLSEGEATFSVAHDAQRPFILSTPGGLVRDVGTVFNVRTDRSGRLDVTVLEGAVQVTRPHSAPVALTAGQQFAAGARVAADAPRVRTLSAQTLGDLVAWREGGALFDGVTLREALERVGEVNHLRVTVSPEIAGLRVGGRFSLEDIDGFTDALQKTLPVRVVRPGDGSMQVVGR